MPADERDQGRRMERRELFSAAGALVAGGLATAGVASAGQSGDDRSYFAAKVAGHPSSDVLEVVPYGTDFPVRVRLAPGARAVHRGAAATLADFAVGGSIAFDVAGRSNPHAPLDERDAGKLFVALHVADCRPGTVATRGERVS